MKLVTSEQMREIDRNAIKKRGIPGLDLMERAALSDEDRKLMARMEREEE